MAAYEVYKLHFIMNLLSVLGQMQLEVKLMLMLPRNAPRQHAGSAQDEVLAAGSPAGPQTHTKDAKHAANAERILIGTFLLYFFFIITAKRAKQDYHLI